MVDQETRSHLLTLPRELRDVIYEYTFTATAPTSTKTVAARNGGLLLACRQTRDETLKLYYNLTTFTHPFHSGPDETAITLVLFVASIPIWHHPLIGTIQVEPSNSDVSVGGPKTHARMRKYYHGELRRFEEELKRFPVADGVLRAKVFCWDGERNTVVWTNRPLEAVPPRLGRSVF